MFTIFKINTFSMQTIVLVSIAMATLLLSGCGENETPENMLQKAIDLRTSGKINSSIIELKNLLQNDPNNTNARIEIARTYLAIDDGASAEKEILRTVELGHVTPTAELLLARAFLFQNKNKETLGIKIQVHDLRPTEQSDYHTITAIANLRLGNQATATTHLKKAIALNSENIEARVIRARIDAGSNRLETALSNIEELVKQYPNSGLAWRFLAEAKKSSSELEMAEFYYTKAIEHSISNKIDYFNRSLVRAALGKYGLLEEGIKELKTRHKQNPMAEFLTGLLALSRNKLNNAQDSFATVTTIAPQYAPAFYYAGLSHYLQNEDHQAHQYLKPYISLIPSNISANLVMASIQMRLKDFEGAELSLNLALSFAPRNADALRLLSNLTRSKWVDEKERRQLSELDSLKPNAQHTYLTLTNSQLSKKEYKESISSLEKASEQYPEQTTTNVMIVMNHIQAKEYDKALEALHELESKDSKGILPHSLRGTILTAKGDYDGAKDAFLKAWKIDTGHPIIGRSLARVALSQENPSEALTYQLKILDRYPNHLMTLLEISVLESFLDDDKSALAHLEHAYKTSSKDPRAWIALIRFYLRNNQLNQALKITNEAPGLILNSDIHLELAGTINQRMGHNEQAVELFRELSTRHPKNSQMALHLALALRANGDTGNAREVLKKANLTSPEDLNIISAWIDLELSTERYEQADKLIDKMATFDPDGSSTATLKARLLTAKKEFSGAAKIYEEILASHPKNGLVIGAAILYLRAEQTTKGINLLRKWHSENPSDALVGVKLAEILTTHKYRDEAIQVYQELLNHHPDYPILLNNLAWIYRNTDSQKAISLSKRAHELAPQSPSIADTYGWLLYRKGEYKAAHAILSRAAKSGTASIRYHLAETLATLNKKDQALELLNQLVNEKFDQRNKALALQKHLERQ